MTILPFNEELKDLCNNRIQQVYPNVSKEEIERDGLVIFGAGNHGKLILEALIANGIKPDWIIDKNPALLGQELNEISIRPLDSLKDIKDQFILLASSYIPSMISDCNNYNVKKWILPIAMKNFCYIAGQFGDGEIINANFDKILSVFQTLEDQLSKDIFSTFLRFNLTFKLNFTEYYDTETYFPLYLENLIDYSHFVDAGAFTGDTLKTWINHFKPQESRSLFSYFAIEPSSEHFNELKEYIDSLPIEVRNKISVEKCAAGSTEEILSLTGTGVTANLHSTLGPRELKEYVSVKKIDNLLSEQKPTIIKADVEGFEMALLEGARSTIKRYHPTLAISVYHNCYDIWEIPIWILNLDCGYKFYIRHHKPTYGDTVCYAIAR